jgi:hypothetical protein
LPIHAALVIIQHFPCNVIFYRLAGEQDLFCETIAIALGLGAQDMADFQSNYDKDRSGQGRLLKAKFAVRIFIISVYLNIKSTTILFVSQYSLI